MVIPSSIKIPVPWDYVAPHGALCLGVEPATDFDKRGQDDDQMRDKETGRRVWVVKVLDLDPEAGKFGGSNELKVKVVADQRPVPPMSAVPGYPPLVEFTDVTLTPYVDSQRCKGNSPKCRARQAWSVRASGMTQPVQKSSTTKVA
ncbi:hypothetical protein [Actinoplanes sp. RD1]|uniref:hypothetical protein n=1 Tax=Actinoplanes sp. RD1 TaxID=3064538 RepID=UPI002741F424|nr:hypothetical protein [Actinoplanes sp. RD1]